MNTRSSRDEAAFERRTKITDPMQKSVYVLPGIQNEHDGGTVGEDERRQLVCTVTQ